MRTWFLGCLILGLLVQNSFSLGLLSVVQFPNLPCNLISTASGGSVLRGVCITSDECSQRGGASDGNCAAGFGVCCKFTLSASGTVNQNPTFLENPAFPAEVAADAEAITYSYMVQPVSNNICQLRLDFPTLELAQPDSTGVCTNDDRLEITAGSGTNPPVLCGENNGQHIYVDTGMQNPAATVRVVVGPPASNPNRWQIKVTQIDCDSSDRAPAGCNQYFMGLTGTLESYNYRSGTDGHVIPVVMNNQCIRQEAGYCDIVYTSVGPTFQLTGGETAGKVGATNCDSTTNMKTYLSISNPDATTENRFCGAKFSEADGSTVNGAVRGQLPFMVTHKTFTEVDSAVMGYKLRYVQTPC